MNLLSVKSQLITWQICSLNWEHLAWKMLNGPVIIFATCAHIWGFTNQRHPHWKFSDRRGRNQEIKRITELLTSEALFSAIFLWCPRDSSDSGPWEWVGMSGLRVVRAQYYPPCSGGSTGGSTWLRIFRHFWCYSRIFKQFSVDMAAGLPRRITKVGSLSSVFSRERKKRVKIGCLSVEIF